MSRHTWPGLITSWSRRGHLLSSPSRCNGLHATRRDGWVRGIREGVSNSAGLYTPWAHPAHSRCKGASVSHALLEQGAPFFFVGTVLYCPVKQLMQIFYCHVKRLTPGAGTGSCCSRAPAMALLFFRGYGALLSCKATDADTRARSRLLEQNRENILV